MSEAEKNALATQGNALWILFERSVTGRLSRCFGEVAKHLTRVHTGHHYARNVASLAQNMQWDTAVRRANRKRLAKTLLLAVPPVAGGAVPLLFKCRPLRAPSLALLRLRCSAISAFKHRHTAQQGCSLPARDTPRQRGSAPVARGCTSLVFQCVGFPRFLLDASANFALWQFPAAALPLAYRVVLLSCAADRAPATTKAASLAAVVAAARAFKARVRADGGPLPRGSAPAPAPATPVAASAPAGFFLALLAVFLRGFRRRGGF
ncbi:uncharacterized protein CDV56_105064 [Aspergillus thermomutatus]|uniref:Uncharacterized protein n=1 Tax=Aspergillus thermomutatus TaxID=41047 RepID=A0A397GMY3_ASPTH|nr:uncharacterized protein CDV56_105064 [Aspergillus thermomutatus]RHZ51088.1 hypothetical protein CDV56_105064 [Aspergillus thermomutatus]